MQIDPRDAPITVAEVDLGVPGYAPAAGEPPTVAVRDTAVMALARLHTHPLGVVGVHVPAGSDLRLCVRQAAHAQLAPEIAEHERRDQAGEGPSRNPVPPCLHARREASAAAPLISVIIGTRERPAELARCLASLAAVDYPRFEVLVVDNDPESDATRQVAEQAAGAVRYLCGKRRGVAVAHNLGAAEANGRILAFTDDDVVVDRNWLAAIAEGFADPRVGCVTGLIMPGELDTREQAMLERRGGYAKGFAQRIFETGADAGAAGGDRLFPFTAGRMGSGANMAFDAGLLAQLHGFDPALGPGTVARAGEDLLALFRAAAAGRRVVYQPDALVWHHHKRDPGALKAQALGYGIGLGAYLTSALVHEPRLVPAFLRLVPRGVGYALRRSHADHDDPDAWPTRLAALERRGLVLGPAAYARSRWLTRHAQPDGSR